MSQEHNLTWVIGDWRFYVAQVELDPAVKQAHGKPDMERWRWSVRKNPIGWEEYGETDGGREQAIIHGLSVMEQIDGDRYTSSYHVTSPALDSTVSAKPTMLIKDFIPLALEATGNQNFNADDWELVGENGWVYDKDLPVGVTAHRPISLVPIHLSAI